MLVKIVREMKIVRVLIAVTIALVSVLGMTTGALALTTADVTVNATPAFVAITCNVSAYNFGTIAANSTTNTSTAYFGITNTSTVQTDQTISVTGATWLGGVAWTHSDTATPAADTVGLKSNKAGTWGVSDVIVKNAAPNFIAENQTASTNYTFGLGLWAPTSFSDGAEKTNTVRVSAVSG